MNVSHQENFFTETDPAIIALDNFNPFSTSISMSECSGLNSIHLDVWEANY